MSTSKDVGDRVQSGTLLASLQSPRVHDSWAAYRKAVAERRRATNELEYAKEAEARAQRLNARSAQEPAAFSAGAGFADLVSWFSDS